MFCFMNNATKGFSFSSNRAIRVGEIRMEFGLSEEGDMPWQCSWCLAQLTLSTVTVRNFSQKGELNSKNHTQNCHINISWHKKKYADPFGKTEHYTCLMGKKAFVYFSDDRNILAEKDLIWKWRMIEELESKPNKALEDLSHIPRFSSFNTSMRDVLCATGS